jgi:type III secretion system YscQ/HrcQ family protein
MALTDEEEGDALRPSRAETLQLVSSTISVAGGRSEAERLIMEDGKEVEENVDAAEGALALDELLLTVRVELGARRISLDELARMRAGQVLELGCRATDPVELIAEDRRIARGELVDIEGRLGVRITQLLG